MADSQPSSAPTNEFEDYLDGYFPLSVSIRDLMKRREVSCIHLKLAYAPILQVDGLAPEAPVPLSIRSGRAGLIDQASFDVDCRSGTVELSGQARWRWLDGTPTGPTFDPMIRLAEPAFVQGFRSSKTEEGIEPESESRLKTGLCLVASVVSATD